jgi:acyl-CoA thioesterase-2
MHGYFLRSGRREIPIIFKVDRDRDGRSFSARRVAAVQDGEVIFDLTASFHLDRSGAEYTLPLRADIPGPDASVEEPWADNFPLAEARVAPGAPSTVGGIQRGPAIWIRTRERLADDRLIHCCALTYMSDIGSGFRNVDIPGLPRGGASLDHSMWFRTPIRADEWSLMELWPFMAGGSRGLYGGSIHSAEGIHGIMLTQEMLLKHPTQHDQLRGG